MSWMGLYLDHQLSPPNLHSRRDPPLMSGVMVVLEFPGTKCPQAARNGVLLALSINRTFIHKHISTIMAQSSYIIHQ